MKGILSMLKIIVAYTNLYGFKKLDVHKFARLHLHAVFAFFVEVWTTHTKNRFICSSKILLPKPYCQVMAGRMTHGFHFLDEKLLTLNLAKRIIFRNSGRFEIYILNSN